MEEFKLVWGLVSADPWFDRETKLVGQFVGQTYTSFLIDKCEPSPIYSYWKYRSTAQVQSWARFFAKQTTLQKLQVVDQR